MGALRAHAAAAVVDQVIVAAVAVAVAVAVARAMLLDSIESAGRRRRPLQQRRPEHAPDCIDRSAF